LPSYKGDSEEGGPKAGGALARSKLHQQAPVELAEGKEELGSLLTKGKR